jgi:hypothetical protein
LGYGCHRGKEAAKQIVGNFDFLLDESVESVIVVDNDKRTKA